MTGSDRSSPGRIEVTFLRDDRGAMIRAAGMTQRLDEEHVESIADALVRPGSDPLTVPLSPVPTPAQVIERTAAAATGPAPSAPATASAPVAHDPVYSVGPRSQGNIPTTAAQALELGRGTVRFSRSARIYAQRYGVDDARVRSVCADPDEEWLAESAKVFYAIGDGIGLTVSTRDGAVLAVRRARDMDALRPAEPRGTPRGRGGSGSRYPRDTAALIDLLEDRGFTVEMVNNGHYRVSRNGRSRQIAATPGDHRTILNDLKSLEQTFQVSLAREPR